VTVLVASYLLGSIIWVKAYTNTKSRLHRVGSASLQIFFGNSHPPAPARFYFPCLLGQVNSIYPCSFVKPSHRAGVVSSCPVAPSIRSGHTRLSHAPSSCASRARVVFTAFRSTSHPTNLRFSLLAATALIPEPRNGSTTKSFSYERFSITYIASETPCSHGWLSLVAHTPSSRDIRDTAKS